MRAHFLSIFAPEPDGPGNRVRYDGDIRDGSEGNVVFPVAVIAGAGWLFLFIVLLTAPPSPGPREGGGPGGGRGGSPADGPDYGGEPLSPDPGDEPPAVVSLL